LIPPAYAAELQIVFNALRDMTWPGDTEWLHGQTGVGAAISDTLMYQRGDPTPSDPDMSSLYGLALPLVKHGTALTMAQLERVATPGYLDAVRVLLLTYEGQKPPSPAIHTALADWVRHGNALLLFGSGDAYDAVREWCESGRRGLRPPAGASDRAIGPGPHARAGRTPAAPVGSSLRRNHRRRSPRPARRGRRPGLREAGARLAGPALAEGNLLALRRGTYVVAAGMDESTGAATALPGVFVNLFDGDLPVLTDPVIAPDTRWLFYDLARCPEHPWVIAASGRIRDEAYDDHSLAFTVEGMADTPCVVRARVPAVPGVCRRRRQSRRHDVGCCFADCPHPLFQ
jgi:hypothetical protein